MGKWQLAANTAPLSDPRAVTAWTLCATKWCEMLTNGHELWRQWSYKWGRVKNANSSQSDSSQTGTINLTISYSVKKHLNFTNDDPWYHLNFKSFQFKMLKSSASFFICFCFFKWTHFELNGPWDGRSGREIVHCRYNGLSHSDVKTAVQSGTLSSLV